MTDPERDHFVRQLRDLERRLRRWRLACLVLLTLLLLPVVLGGLLGVTWVPRLERERAARLDAERERDVLEDVRLRMEVEHQAVAEEETKRRAQVEKPLREADWQRAVAEEEARRRARQGRGKDKD
jgi:hypothetical protein